VDIAGLVRGASKGEGLGNQFLSHIREVDAIAHVVRCFEDENVIHVENRIDPIADLATIETELCLKDLETVEKRAERARKMLKANRPEDRIAVEVCDVLIRHLNESKPVRTLFLPGPDGKIQGPAILESAEGRKVVDEMQLLTMKPVFYAANVDEASLANLDANPHYKTVVEHAKREGTKVVPICAALEAQIAELDPEERPEFLASVGLEQPGLANVIRTGYELLGLITFFTAGEVEVRAWTITKGTLAPGA